MKNVVFAALRYRQSLSRLARLPTFQSPTLQTNSRSFCVETAQEVPNPDDALIFRGDFRGVAAANFKQKGVNNPEITLANVQQSLKRNYRVSGETILVEVVQKLERNDAPLISALRYSPDRWVPLLLSACGSPLSNVQKSAREQILDRLWAQLIEKEIKLTAESWNARLNAMLENESVWDPWKELTEMEKSEIEPNNETFSPFDNEIGVFGRWGYVVSEDINAALVFCFAVRGHHAKADSLAEAQDKYGDRGVQLAKGALVRAAAARGDTDRLRLVLRRSVDVKTKKLTLKIEDTMETIWQLAEKSRDGTAVERTELVEQMMSCTVRDAGFFHKLFREIERHISHRHYYTAITLLEDTKRISDLFLHQLVSRLATQLIRNGEPMEIVRDVANRVHYAFNEKERRIRLYDDLLFAALMMKKLTWEERFDYLTAFIDQVDRRREREHLILPILTTIEDVEDRMPVLYRFINLGYSNLSNLDIGILSELILQPLFDQQGSRRDMSRLDKLGRVLKSYGVKEKSLWLIMHDWYKRKLAEERYKSNEEEWEKPHARDLRGWCRAYYSETFETPKPTAKPPVRISYEKLKSLVEQKETMKLTAVLSGGGWPPDTDFEEIVPSILSLYLEHESWNNVTQILASLSSISRHSSVQWETDASKTPVKNYHLLSILLRSVQEDKEFNVRKLTDFAYELRNLFPFATSHYGGFFETQYEYNKLFSRCFERLEGHRVTVESIDELIDFLRSLVKLDMIQLHQSETLTVTFVHMVLRKFGWDEALNTWQKFLSGLHCSNGMVALLRNCLTSNREDGKKDVQYVLHRAATFMSKSRVNCLYAAVLLLSNRAQEAEGIGGSAGLRDGHAADELVEFDEQFMLDFASLCLRKLKLAENKEVAQMMQVDLLRICDSRHMGPTALRVYELFADYGVELGVEERNRLSAAIEKHGNLARRWMFAPEGFLKLSATDEIITESEESKIEERLKNDSIKLETHT
ncbi:unnamed protein product [Caenorhabditis auriculariae]|uniref:Uncharacterized protein n=1 Tax=Caenorhabditis auriculariae TaxID=2777116 RepID=A0A8S1HK99_9PELO|nr:unnamed protein product [Caenorhabditis auriculariae]